MTSKAKPEEALVEPSPEGEAACPTPEQELGLRIRQQEILAELGATALKGIPFDELAEQVVQAGAEGLNAECCKLTEYLRIENRLQVRAGVGWCAGTVGVATIGTDTESPSGFALQTGKPVISNHLETEGRFRTPALLLEHGIRRAINVIVQGEGEPYGVLEVDSRDPGKFTDHDVTFLQGAANLLGMAIERLHKEQALRAALERQQLLAREINHRVKNSLQLVASMLKLQASNDPAASERLQEASGRIAAIGRAHDSLYRTDNVEKIDIKEYLESVCQDRTDSTPDSEVTFQAEHEFTENPVLLDTDRAIAMALAVTELVLNAARHAYPNGMRRHVWVCMSRGDNLLVVSVRDEGSGLPPNFQTKGTGFGTRLVSALVKQMCGRLRVERLQPGTAFVIEIPMSLPPAAAPG
jgi:two-component sensor histidine kinase